VDGPLGQTVIMKTTPTDAASSTRQPVATDGTHPFCSKAKRRRYILYADMCQATLVYCVLILLFLSLAWNQLNAVSRYSVELVYGSKSGPAQPLELISGDPYVWGYNRSSHHCANFNLNNTRHSDSFQMMTRTNPIPTDERIIRDFYDGIGVRLLFIWMGF